MNKIVQIKIFNDILDQLFDFLEHNFPYFKSDIMLTRSTTEFIRNSNPRMVVEKFMNYAITYKQQIFDCDEDFFINFEKNISMKSDNILYGMKLKNVWQSPETSDHQKAHIWLYFQKLVKAGEKVM